GPPYAPVGAGESKAPLPMNDISRVHSAIERGDPQAAEQLLPLVYDKLCRLAARELRRPDPRAGMRVTRDLRLHRRSPVAVRPRLALRRWSRERPEKKFGSVAESARR